MRTQNRVMASGATDERGPRAPRPGPRPGRARVLLALAVSVLVTLAIAGPLAYQAATASDGTGDRPATTTSTTATPEVPTTGVTVPGPVPSAVLPETIVRDDPELSWTSADQPGTPVELEGATVRGEVVVGLDEDADVAEIQMWVEDAEHPTGHEPLDTVAPESSSTVAPDGHAVLDTTSMPDGTYTLQAEATRTDGSTIRRISEFRIANRR